MNRDDVVRMAREAGIHIAPTPDPLAIGDFCSAYRLERFAQAIEQHLIETSKDKFQKVDLDQAINLAKLWSEGKMIGGDAYAVSVALLNGLEQAVRDERERILNMQADGLAALIRESEREACAKVCDAEAQVLPYPIGSKSAEICAELIRSRMFPNTTIHALA